MSTLYKDTIIGCIREYEEAVNNLPKEVALLILSFIAIMICLLSKMFIPGLILVGFSVIVINAIIETKQDIDKEKTLIKRNIEKYIGQMYFEKTGSLLKRSQKCNIKCEGKTNLNIKIETANLEAIKSRLEEEFSEIERESFKHLKLKIVV